MSKVDYHEGLPIERLKELEAQGIIEYRLKISRKGDNGTLMSLKTVLVTLAEMSNLEEILNRYAGGGQYFLQAFNPDEGLTRLFAFRLSIVGAPKIPADRAPGAVPMAPQPDGERTIGAQLFSAPTPAEPGTTFGRPLMAGAQYANPTEQIALGTVDNERARQNRLEAKLDELQREREAERVMYARQLEEERKERDRAAQEAERQRHALEIKRLEDLIASNSKPKGLSIAEVIAAMTPLIPLGIAVIDARKHSASVESDRLNKMNEIQMAGANKLMEATLAQRSGEGAGSSKTLETLIPLAIPLITTFLNSNGPKAQAELMAAQADVQMQQVAMLAQMIEQVTSQAPESPYIPLIQQAMETLAAGVQAYAKTQARPSAAQAIASTLKQQFSGPPAQVDSSLPKPAASAPVAERTPGESVADAVFAHPACPAELKTQEWFTIIAMIHDQAPVAAVAETVSNHLLNLDSAKTTPAFLEPFWAEPEKTLSKLFSFLPIWQTQILYAKQIIAKVISILSAPVDDESDDDGGDNEDDDEDDEGEGDDTEEAAIVTPSPAAPATAAE